MAIVKRFNVNKQPVTLDPDIIENMSANDVSYNDSFLYDENTVGNKLSKLESEVIYDVTANNNGATFTSLSELLSSENLSTIIPTSVRHGGMSIRFINNSENTYVKYHYMETTTTDVTFTDVANWQGVDDIPTSGSKNLVKSGGIFSELIKINNILGISETILETPIVNRTWENYKLNGTGDFVYMIGYSIIQYKGIVANQYYKFTNNGTYTCIQFTNNTTISSQTTVGEPIQNFNGYIKAPVGSTFLSISYKTSQSPTPSIQHVDLESLEIENIKSDISELEDNILELQKDIKYVGIELIDKLSPIQTWNNMELDGDGSWKWGTGQVNRYEINGAKSLYLKINKYRDYVYEFHSNSTLSSNSLIGSVINVSASGIYDVPKGATFLFTNSVSYENDDVYIATDKIKDLDNRVAVIENEITYIPEDIIPSDLYVLKSVPYYIYSDAILRTIDGTNEFSVIYNCEIGKSTNRGFYINYDSIVDKMLTIKIYNSNGILLKTITTTIHIINNDFTEKSANIVVVGDSTESGQKYVKPAKQYANEHNGSEIKFVGTQRNSSLQDCADEGYGGMTFEKIVANGSDRLYIYISDQYSYTIVADSVYSIQTSFGNGSVKITEINNTSPKYISGELTLPEGASKDDFMSAVPATGTITKISGSGDNSVDYIRMNLKNTNPFFNPLTEQMDIAYYKNKINVNKINIGCFILGINDMDWGSEIQSTVENAVTLYNFFSTECDYVIVGLTTDCCCTLSGLGNHYGNSSRNEIIYRNRMFELRKMLINTFSDIETYPKAKILMLGGTIDRYYGYPHTDTNQYYYDGVTEFENTDARHPNSSGQVQGSMSLLSIISYLL